MSPRSRRIALGSLGAVALVAAAALSAGNDAAFTSTAGLGDADGAQIYSHICQGCHMAQGQGAVGAGYYPELAGDRSLASWRYIALTVLDGRNGMPPFGLPSSQAWEIRAAHLSDAQVADVVNYVRTHFGNHYQGTVSAAQVAALPHPGIGGAH